MTPESAATEWGAHSPVLLSHRENAVYVVEWGGKRAALRLHRPGYMSRRAIASELWWMQSLVSQGFPCPAPIPLPDGGLVRKVGDQMATMVTWVEGSAIGEGGVLLPGDRPAQARLMARIGAMMARMHSLSDAMIPPDGFDRPAWDMDGFLGDKPTWGQFWKNPNLTDRDRALVDEGRIMARQALSSGLLDVGLIHADLLRENVFLGPQGLTFIDFDDAGIGFRLYDITTSLTQSLEDPELPNLAQALLRGYDDVRRLSDFDLSMMPIASLLRSLAALGWVMSRYPADHPKMPVYIARATRSVEALQRGRNFFLEGFE
jgi:Ser/Thr protein kinase RdoA (MazF antagonist)